jgi:pyruvate formate lyase activating enzyme
LKRSMDGSDNLWNEKEIFEFLEKRKKFLDGVVISGGEPTLQKDILSFCRNIKQMGFKIKLDSNGSRPEILSMLFEESLIDFIAMDIKTRPDMYSLVQAGHSDTSTASAILASIGCIMEKAPDYEFRTTCVKPFITPEILENIGCLVQGASNYVLQPCSQNVRVLDSSFITDASNFYSAEEMERLRKIIGKYAVSASVR